MRPILPWNIPTGGRCAQTHTVPRVQARSDAFPERPFPHLLQNSCAHTTASHCSSRDVSRNASSQRSDPIGILQALQSFVRSCDWVFEVLFPRIFIFASWIIVFLLPVLGGLHCPEGFLLFDSHLAFLGSCCPPHLSVVTVQLFPFIPFNSFVNCLAEGMPVRINQRRPPICRPQCGQY